MKKNTTPTTVRLSPYGEEEIKRRTSVSASKSDVINRGVDRYFEVCHRSMPDFSEAELNLCRDALNGCWMLEARHVAWCNIEIADAINLNGIDVKWEVDRELFLKKLEAMNYAEKVALVDSVERFWAEDMLGKAEDMPSLDAVDEPRRGE